MGAVSALIFILLLIVRLGLLEKEKADQTGVRPFNERRLTDREVWMNIFQQDQKIGYVHRQFFSTLEGYRVLESVFMQINAMGMVQDIRFKTEGNLHPDLTLSSFDFELLSGLFPFKARGALQGQILTLLITSGKGSEQKVELPLKKTLHLSTGLLEALGAEDLKPRESRTFYVFDPMTATERPVTFSMLSEQTIPIMGRQETAKKVSVDFMGMSQVAWIGKDGAVLKEEGALGIRLEQVTRREALEKISLLPGTDLAEFASIPANKVLSDVEKLNGLKFRLGGVEEGDLFLNGDRQSLKGGVLTIRKESAPSLPPHAVKPRSEEMEAYLAATPFIQSDLSIMFL